jgi:hypothetical protein
MLKRRARYLPGGNRLPNNWWGVGILAAAQLCCADAGLEEYPVIPCGTTEIVVKEPPPRDAFMPRAEPATIFGPCEFVSGASWTYQHGVVKARTNIQPQGMSEDDLNWVKVHMSSWDTPDTPMPLPLVQLYDATSLAPVAPVPDGATRETATCPACICIRRTQRIVTLHTLIWGECLHATPPPPVVEGPLAEVEPVLDAAVESDENYFGFEDIEVEPRASALVDDSPVPSCSDPYITKLFEFPHASATLSDAATGALHRRLMQLPMCF